MTLSIPFPAIPIKVTVGKEKKEDAPVPASHPEPGIAKADVAIVCISAVAILAMFMIFILAMRQGVIR